MFIRLYLIFEVLIIQINVLDLMWVPQDYQLEDRAEIISFIKEVGLATLICMDEQYPIATHTPIEIERNPDGEDILRGHIAKANPQSELLLKEPNVLAIFLSPIQHYVSSSWYEKPNAPTWNYMSVHVYGKLNILTGDALWDSVSRLTDKHEQISRCPVSLPKLPKHIQNMLRGVTGFEISIDKIEAAHKLSQNRNKQDYKNIIHELTQLDTPQSNLMGDTLTKNR